MFLKMLLSEHAYLDPGSGSFIIQLVLAAVLGGGFALKVYWKKIVGHFKKDQGEEMPAAAETFTENTQDGK